MTLTRNKKKKDAISLFLKDYGKENRKKMREYEEEVEKIKNSDFTQEEVQQARKKLIEEFKLFMKAQRRLYEDTMKKIEFDIAKELYYALRSCVKE